MGNEFMTEMNKKYPRLAISLEHVYTNYSAE